LVAIEQEDARYAKDGQIEREDAEKVAAEVKSDHPVFKAITVVEGENTWDYDYEASPKAKKKGAMRKKLKFRYVEYIAQTKKFILQKPFHKLIRDTFYPGKYWASTYEWKRNKLKKLSVPGGRFRDKGGKAVSVDEATIDHQPRVVEHWKKRGRNTTHDKRALFYNGGSDDSSNKNLEVISRSKNSSDGAEARNRGLTYDPEVGPNFRGPNDEQ
jgi:hypothetical protein